MNKSFNIDSIPSYIKVGKTFSSMRTNYVPNVIFGNKYYVLLGDIWIQCVFNSLFYDPEKRKWRFHVTTPDNKSYLKDAKDCLVFSRKEYLIEYLKDFKSGSFVNMECIEFILGLMRDCPYFIGNFEEFSIKIYEIAGGKPRLSSAELDCIWIDGNGIHYRIVGNKEMFSSIEDCISHINIKDSNNVDQKKERVFKIKLDVEVVAESREEAIKKALLSL